MLYVSNVSYTDFIGDEEKQDAIIRKIEVAGEATKKISNELRQQHKHLPWRAMAGMRDKLIHDYFDIDLDTIWETVRVDIPTLIPEIQKIIQALENEEKLD